MKQPNKWGGVIENILWSGDYLGHTGQMGLSEKVTVRLRSKR